MRKLGTTLASGLMMLNIGCMAGIEETAASDEVRIRCNDGDPCTSDTRERGRCVHTPITDGACASPYSQNDMGIGDDAGDDFASASAPATMSGTGVFTAEDSWDCYLFNTNEGEQIVAKIGGLETSTIDAFYFWWVAPYYAGTSLKGVAGPGTYAADAHSGRNGEACVNCQLCLYPGDPNDSSAAPGTGNYSLEFTLQPRL